LQNQDTQNQAGHHDGAGRPPRRRRRGRRRAHSSGSGSPVAGALEGPDSEIGEPPQSETEGTGAPSGPTADSEFRASADAVAAAPQQAAAAPETAPSEPGALSAGAAPGLASTLPFGAGLDGLVVDGAADAAARRVEPGRVRADPAPRSAVAPASAVAPRSAVAPAPAERAAPGARPSRQERRRMWREARDERRRQRQSERTLEHQHGAAASDAGAPAEPAAADGAAPAASESSAAHAVDRARTSEQRVRGETEGLLVIERANHGHLRVAARDFKLGPEDVHVPPWLVQKLRLATGAWIKGTYGRGSARNKYELIHVAEVDGKPPSEARVIQPFKSLVSIDPDFHYAVGDLTGDTSLRVIDLICPIGRGQRGLIVASPRSGKTILLQKIAKAIETHYSDVELLVLLVDERPEEATEWKRTVQRGTVYVSTNDESAQSHVDLAEVVWARCQRLVELGRDAFLVIDSITRLARAYNNTIGDSGRTMSGGIDSRTMERPKQFFGSARNTEKAGSLTILGTTLVETGSRMDQVIFEEFKGTGNMELVLNRKLSDRRIFPAIDVQRSGTRKEEKLLSARRLKLVATLRRVLLRMNFIDAMELLIQKIEESKDNDEFLARFEIDPEQ
jgi:transcription termination factor Rho